MRSRRSRTRVSPRSWVVLGLALLVWLGGCSRRQERAVRPAGPPQRIVSLAPSVTETLFALRLGDRVVGVTRYCDFPPAALEKPKVGGFLDPSYEAIVGLAPDLVIVQQDSADAEDRLSRLGIATLRVDQHTIAGIVSSIESIATACGVAERGTALAAELQGRLAKVAELTRGRPRPRTLVVVGREPGARIRSVWVAGAGVFYSEVVELAGGVNAYSGPGGAFPEVSREGLEALDPDVILDIVPQAARRGLGAGAVREEWRELGDLRAVRAGRVEVLEEAFMERPGPRVVEMVQRVARALHPEVAWPTP